MIHICDFLPLVSGGVIACTTYAALFGQLKKLTYWTEQLGLHVTHNLRDRATTIFKHNVENNYDEKKSVISILFNRKHFVNIPPGHDSRIAPLDPFHYRWCWGCCELAPSWALDSVCLHPRNTVLKVPIAAFPGRELSPNRRPHGSWFPPSPLLQGALWAPWRNPSHSPSAYQHTSSLPWFDHTNAHTQDPISEAQFHLRLTISWNFDQDEI